MTAFDKYLKKSTLICGGSDWERCDLMRERKEPMLDTEKLLNPGQEQTLVGTTVSSNQLNVKDPVKILLKMPVHMQHLPFLG